MNGKQKIGQLFHERSEFIVIGLTGRTGSGCTTAATFLEEKELFLPSIEDLNIGSAPFYKGLDLPRYKILKAYAEKNWNRFYSIKVSDLISAYLLTLSITDAETFIVHHGGVGREKINAIRTALTDGSFSTTHVSRKFKVLLNNLITAGGEVSLKKSDTDRFISFLKLVRKFTNDFKLELKKIEDKLYINTYQAAGNSIRRIGYIAVDFNSIKFNPSSVFALPETINRVIKIIKQTKEKAFIAIDAIRNPYEAKFFKDRYSAFYLVSINAPHKDRSEYLKNIHKFSLDQLEKLETIESGKYETQDSNYVSQNVKRCIEISDLHIFNPRVELENNNVLHAQLGWYVALMMHPGLVTPTAMERVMQMAYTAKINSGCISRQVGAVITDQENSVKAIGWNDVPAGQTPCSLRSFDGLFTNFSKIVYSDYERNDTKFRDVSRQKWEQLKKADISGSGRPLSYCFKDLKNSIDKKSNQVHTRSLHAEENAFLQIVKYGGQAIKGGKLYTTASPCELCAKKAYQLEIAEIIYIDPYPGIATEHILSIGMRPPKLIQFRGAVGKGYHTLYEPALPYKDELEILAE